MNKKNVIKILKQIHDKDLEVRLKLQELTDEKEIKNLWDKIHELDEKHQQILVPIIDKFGLITINEFGKETSKHAWLIVQHMKEENICFMKKYLNMMESNLDSIDKRNYATLKDRILSYENKPQIYGTQFVETSDGKIDVYKIYDRENVNLRRAEVGLYTLEEDLADFEN